SNTSPANWGCTQEFIRICPPAADAAARSQRSIRPENGGSPRPRVLGGRPRCSCRAWEGEICCGARDLEGNAYAGVAVGVCSTGTGVAALHASSERLLH